MRPALCFTGTPLFRLQRFCGLLALSNAFTLPAYGAPRWGLYSDPLPVALLLGSGLALLAGLALARFRRLRALGRQQQTRLALVDPQTGLPSRAAAEQYLARKIVQAQQYNGSFAVLQMALHDFRRQTAPPDDFPAEAGLLAASRRLAACIREQDLFARLGGDTFTAIITCSSQQQVQTVIARLQQALAPPFLVNEVSLGVTLSIGVSFFPQPGDVTGALLQQQAALALEAARNTRRSDGLIYTPGLATAGAAPGTAAEDAAQAQAPR